MPSRKSNASSEATLSSNSRRSSLRRLSSIASLQNLFTRRRSQNIAEQPVAVSSHSDLSTSTSSSIDDSTLRACGDTHHLDHGQDEQDELKDLPAQPPPTHSNYRRSSYICLPDDPIGGMPRSRTFSNLPVPTRAKKASATNLISHGRVPSSIWPSTQLPSPPVSTRKHSHSRLMSGPPTRMQRSDTEPLLGLQQGYGTSHHPRSTAFKENISLSAIKPIPALDMEYHETPICPSSSPHKSYHPPPGVLVASSNGGIDTLSSSATSDMSSSPSPPPSIAQYVFHPAIQIVRDYKSSPARPLYRSSRDRPATPGASTIAQPPRRVPAQRWISQPVLTARTNNHEYPPRKDSKYHKEVKPTRLLSARQAPTPQPPKTPLVTGVSGAIGSRTKSGNNSASAGHVRQVSEQTPTQSEPKIRRVGCVVTYEPPAYWAGRVSALADRYRNEDLTSSLPSSSNGSKTSLTPKAQTDKLHTPEASTARLKRALAELESRCVTNEAKESLYAFQTQFAQMMKLPELKPPKLVVHLGSGNEDEGGVALDGSGGDSLGEGRKASFMDRLLGRQGKRRSLVLA